MSNSDYIDPKKLSFSQAFGDEEIPKRLKLGEISDEARTSLWNALYEAVLKVTRINEHFPSYIGSPWDNIFLDLHTKSFKLRRDEWERLELDVLQHEYGEGLLKEWEFNKIFDFLLDIMRHEECPSEFINDVAETFERCQLAYIVDKDHPVTIYPTVTETEGKTILKARKQLRDDGFFGAEAHLQKATDFLHQGEYADSILHSMHAVESVARKLAPDSNSLGKALRVLEEKNPLHRALREGLKALYGYTSDEKGIRHSLIDEKQANVGMDEAVFMLGTCAAFSSYLLRKYQT